MKKAVLLSALAIILVGCSDEQVRLKYEEKIAELEQQLDECKNGADKIFAKAELAYNENDYGSVKTFYTEMEKRYPDSPHFSETKKMYEEVLAIEEAKRKEKEKIAAAAREKRMASLKKLRKKYDDVSGVTWYKQPYFTHYTNTNLTSIYMGESNGIPWLRLMMSYEGDDWIFFERAYLSYDGNTKEIVFNKYDNKETENGGGSVWEWIDLTVSSDVEMFLREFAKSPNAKMRLTGKYTETRNLTRNERKGIQLVLEGYDALKAENK